MKVILFGTGNHYEKYKIFFRNDEVLCLLDNDMTIQGTVKDGVLILSPEKGIRMSYDFIFVLSTYRQEIIEQLHGLGVPMDKILQEDDIYIHYARYWQNESVLYYGTSEMPEISTEDKIVALTDDLEITGAVVALQNLLLCWQQNGESVVVVSPVDGDMRREFVNHGIPVIIAEGSRILPLDELTWLRNPRLIVLNTIFMYKNLLYHKRFHSVMWWLHDSEMLYQGIDLDSLKKIDYNNVYLYAVSNVAAEALKRRISYLNIGRLAYGIEDEAIVCKKNAYTRNSKLVFAIVGEVSKRKAVDVFLASIRQLDKALISKCEFWIIGRHETVFGKKIYEEANRISSVRLHSVLGRREILSVYKKIDVLVCPSRDDSLPVVVAEAMMFSHPCIVSDSTGMACYIRPKINGLVCATGNVNDLTACMKWIISNRDRLADMGRASRKTYELNFSFERLSENARVVLYECTKN